MLVSRTIQIAQVQRSWLGQNTMPQVRSSDSCLISPRHFSLLLAILSALVVLGCGKQTGPVAQEQSNLSWLGSKYGMFVGSHRGRTPKSIDEFKKFVEKKTKAAELERLKVKDVNELFISPRDGKPFKMVNHAKLPPLVGGQPPPIVFYEEVGHDGKRSIAYLGGNTQTIENSALQSLLPAEGR